MKITHLAFLSIVLIGSTQKLPAQSADQQKAKQQKKERREKKKKRNKKRIPIVEGVVHPFFSLEKIPFENEKLLQIGGMQFHENSLYAVTLTPDRLDDKPDHNGKLVRIDNIHAGATEKPSLTVLCEGFYEPCAVGIAGGSIYVGTKDQILRFDQAVGKDKLEKKDATIMLDGISTINFHTYTIGFEHYQKDGKNYFCGNFTTAIQRGGRRDYMIPPNENVHRGSTFLFGPITGNEDPSEVSLDYISGGYRTPNGIGVGPDNEVYVTDNQGIFNPSNKLLRLEQGGFYGHWLYNKPGKGRAAKFQPADVDPAIGDVSKITPPTLHLPQSSVARSPAQPIVIQNRKGVLAPYNGQLLLCDFTSGQILRASLEEVEGVWQGVVFKHTMGKADKMGNGGFTAGPNRLVEGPDGNYYVGQIGAGSLWSYNETLHGLQRFRVKSEGQVDPSFNEILNVKVCDGGFEIEFLKPVKKASFQIDQITVSQWTYYPTSNYGGPPISATGIKPSSMTFDELGKKMTLIIDGLKDGNDILKEDGKSNENSGWVTRIKLNGAKGAQNSLYTQEFWYTLHRKIGGKDDGEYIGLNPLEKAHNRFQAQCMACHQENDAGLLAPDLKGIINRKQTVIDAEGNTKEVVIDEDYVINAILHPNSEKLLKFKDMVMPPTGLTEREAKDMVKYLKTLKPLK